MLEIRMHKIAKIFVYFFFIYVLWFIYVFGEHVIILYGTALAATVFVGYGMIRTGTNIRSFCPWGVFLNFIMCVYSILTGIFVAKDQEVLFSAVKTYGALSIVCFDICYISNKEKSIDWLADFFILINIVCSLQILVRGFYVLGYGYVLSADQNPNILGLTMDLGVFSVAYKSVKTKKRKLLYFCIAVLFLYTIINCGSRKCLIAALIICALWLSTFAFQMWKKGVYARIGLFFILGALAFGVLYYYQNVYVHTYSYNRMEILGSTEKGTSSQIRTMYYQYALDYFYEHPLFGIGLAQFAIWNPKHGYSHSTYAEVLANWGFVGCLLYFIPAIVVGVKLIRALVKGSDPEMTRIFIALWAMEMFIGVGQIWFYQIEHLTAWTIIFLYYDMHFAEKQVIAGRSCKYVKA